MSEAEDRNFERIGSNVIRELDRRLADPKAAAELPGTLLMKLAENYLKYLERKQGGGDEEKPLTALELIDQDGLSLEKKYEILTGYLGELEDEWRAASKRMVQLQKEIEKAVKNANAD